MLKIASEIDKDLEEIEIEDKNKSDFRKKIKRLWRR